MITNGILTDYAEVEMLIVVTDITRMRGSNVCVAGMGLKTGRRVRPVLPNNKQLTRNHLCPTRAIQPGRGR